jgi:hypothetical protein
MWDILGQGNDFQWATSDGRVVVWIELQFIDESLVEPASKPRKPRSKVKSTAPRDRSQRASTIASVRVKSELNQPLYEPISLKAFPQDLARDTPSETAASEVSDDTDLFLRPAVVEVDEAVAADEAHDNPFKNLNTAADEVVSEAVGEADSASVSEAVDQVRKRPRASTAGSADEEARPRRSQRETRPTARARRS